MPIKKSCAVLLCALLLVPSLAAAQGGDLDFLFEDEPAAPPAEEADAASGAAEPAPPSSAADEPPPGVPTTRNKTTTEQADAPREAPAKSAQTDARAARSRLVEEIIVTAQKREENIKDVPVTVQAFNAGFLDAKGVSDQRDLPKITPGLNFSNPIGFGVAYLRGIGSDAFILADPLVVSYVDGVYFPNSTSQFLNFGSVERVEVLKGPQGTLFGRNALGGAIKVETRTPDLEKLTGSFKSRYSSEDHSFNNAYISVPLLENHLAVSASGYYQARDDFRNGRRAVGLPEEGSLPRERNDAYRIKLFWKPLDWFDTTLNVFEYNQDNTRLLASANTMPSGLGGVFIEPQDSDRPLSNEAFFNNNSGRTYFGDINLRTPWFDTKLLASTQDVASDRSYDFDGSAQPLAYFEGRPIFANTDNVEFRILSNDFGPDWLKWIAGLYLFDSVGGINRARLRAGGTSFMDGTILGTQVPFLEGLATTLADQNIPLPNGLDVDFSGRLRRESIAYFGEFTIDITDWFSLTLGGRYLSAERTVLQSQAAIINVDDSRTQFRSNDFNSDPGLRLKNREFDPKVVLNFRPGSGFLGSQPLLYASYQTASISDTFNVISPFNPPDLALGSTIRAFELGYKTRLLNNLIDFNAAAFHYTEKNPQIQIISLQTGGAVRFENADELEINGLEFSLVSPLFPDRMPGSLVIDMGATYLDHEYTDYDGAGGFTGAGGTFNETNDFTGNPVQYASDFTGNLGLTQTLEVPGGPLELGLNYYYNDGFFTFAQATPNVQVDAYQTLGLRMSYLHQRSNLRAALFGRNVLDADYQESRFITDFGVNDFPAEGPVYGASLQWEF